MRSVQWTATQGVGSFLDTIIGVISNFRPYAGRNPFEQFGTSGVDTLRGTPLPTPPRGVMSWPVFEDFLIQVVWAEPGKLTRVYSATALHDQQAARQYREYGVRTVRDFGKLAQRSLDWWRNTAYFKSKIAKWSRHDVAEFFAKAQQFITLMKNA